MVSTIVDKWGNAAGLRLPKAFCDQLGIRIGDEVDVELADNRLVITPLSNRPTLDALLKDWNGVRQQSPEIDWGTDAGAEEWDRESS